jgi:phosphoribosylanthranilate isomerase
LCSNFPHMLRVKICGVTSREDALNAERSGADAIGLQFFKGSVRYVTPDQAMDIRKSMPPFVSVVGIFVDADRDEILRMTELVGLDYIQLSGNESPDSCRDLPARTIKTIRVGSRDDLVGLDRYPVDVLHLDSQVGSQYGGTGRTFDWSLVEGFATSKPLVVAGGLNPDNVADAVRATRPHAVDVCSGVESAPAIKDYDKMRRFVDNARSV